MLSTTTGSPVLISGAASGIGRAIALRLATEGRPVALLDRNAEALALAAKEAEREGSPAALALVADVADGAAVRAAVADAVRALGLLGGLASAAGILEPGGLADVTSASWERHFAVNTTGVLHLLQHATAQMSDGGAVVVISSNAARVPRTGLLAYAASKAATSALTRSAGLELAARRIRCNVIEPGSTDTAMQRDLWPDAEVGRASALDGDPSAYRLGIPLGRIADPDDIAGVAAFLLSDAARHVTLQQLFVDGGASL
ncbi:SDR family oxidoreductase [Nocardioides sp. Kera G14]|uniref:SDR family oxidoreductase n=1 Tax=Nocardioides sp. Kera G14 TaxID=2884264 RepID=UPI001D1003A1|nr:SDR family oxidoreductase [Nocardioides sp. Kera G14]UDY24263.1 SDR family oxidoreductase [Nocardioides sp. Kera G14]